MAPPPGDLPADQAFQRSLLCTVFPRFSTSHGRRLTKFAGLPHRGVLEVCAKMCSGRGDSIVGAAGASDDCQILVSRSSGVLLDVASAMLTARVPPGDRR